ncbi:MAG: rhodanese-like domain-containing protein, partial [Phycisphaerales bacterium]|nr:rhodanese-like domain-containing protein [Phycisphaerales bacterium]
MTLPNTSLSLEIPFNKVSALPKAFVIDCRSTEEFDAGHVANSCNIPLQHLSIRKDDFPCDCDDHFFVYCKSGNRSATFATYLRSIGYTKCQSIKGGFEQWGEQTTC